MHACSKIIHPHCSSLMFVLLTILVHSLFYRNKSFARNQKPINKYCSPKSWYLSVTKLTHIIKQKAKEYQPSPHAESSWYSGAWEPPRQPWGQGWKNIIDVRITSTSESTIEINECSVNKTSCCPAYAYF
jgi:hypothetical protein